MEEINQNSQTSLDFNTEKFEPKDEIEIQQIIKFCYKKNLPIEIVGNKTPIIIPLIDFKIATVMWYPLE